MQVLIWLALAAIFIFFIVKMNNLLKRTEELENNTGKRSDLKLILHRLEELEKEIRRLKGLTEIKEPPEPSLREEIPIEEEELEVPQVTAPQPPPQVTSSTSPSTQPFQESQRTFTFETVTQPSRTREEWEALIGGKLLNRIGALALIIGIGFFLKYAFDKNWITETMRVLIGSVIGMVLLFVGSRSHKKEFRIFAQGLIGAGISILYLSVYASFNFYHLVPQVIAFSMMSVVTIITFSQAFKYNSLAVSVLGWVGGFLTPFLLSTGKANEVGLFTYIALLDVGLLIVLLRKDSWIILEPLTFAATYLTYLLWYLKFYTPADLSVTILFLSIFWGLFYAMDVCRIVTSNAEFRGVRQVIATFNVAFYYWAMYAIINPKHHGWMGLITLGIGAIYFLTVLGIKRRWPDDTMILARYFLTAIALLIAATTIQFSGFTTVIYWSLEAMILVWCGIHWRLRYVWQAALGQFCIALIKLLVTEGALVFGPIQNFTLLFNRRALSFSLLTATLGMSAYLFKDMNEKRGEIIKAVLHYVWCALLFVLCTIETADYFRWLIIQTTGREAISLEFIRLMMLPTVWMVYSLLLVWFGLRKEIVPILSCGLGALGFAVGLGAIRGVSFQPIETFTLVLNLRSAVLILLILGLVLQEKWLGNRRETYPWIDQMQIVLQSGWCILLFLLCTVETNDYFRWLMIHAKGALRDSHEYNRFMILAAVWTIYSLPLVWYGVKKHVPPLLYSGLCAFALAVLLGGIRGITFEPIEKFISLMNVRAIVLFLIIIGAFAHFQWLRKYRQTYSWARKALGVLQIILVLLILDLVTGEIWDYFGKPISLLSKPLLSSGFLSELSRLTNLRQLSISGSWLIYSIILMGIGIWQRIPRLRIISIVLFGATILKIFIYDLSFLETLYRIFSFVGLGLILLATSYLYQRYKAVIFETGRIETDEKFGSEFSTESFRKGPEEEIAKDEASPKFRTREEYERWKAEKMKNVKE